MIKVIAFLYHFRSDHLPISAMLLPRAEVDSSSQLLLSQDVSSMMQLFNTRPPPLLLSCGSATIMLVLPYHEYQGLGKSHDKQLSFMHAHTGKPNHDVQ